MRSKPWYLSTKIWLAVAAACASLAGGLPDLGEAMPVIRSVLTALTAAIGAWVIVLRVLEGNDPDSPEAPIRPDPPRGRATVLALVHAAILGLAALVLVSCGPLTQREQGAVQVGVTGVVGLGCDIADQLYPDNPWIGAACRTGEIIAMAILATTMGLDADDPASKSATVDVFEPGASPTMHTGCGAFALRCHRYGGGEAQDFCASALASCEAGVSSVWRVGGQ